MAPFTKIIVLRFFHQSKLLLPQQLPPPSQYHLQRKVNSWLWEHVKQEGDTPCLFMAWQPHLLPCFSVTACLNAYDCSWERRDIFPQDTAGGVRQGNRRRSCKKHSHLSLLPHPTPLAGWSRENISWCGYCLYGLLQSGCSHVQTTAAHWIAALGASHCSC